MITNLSEEHPWSQKEKYTEKGFLRLLKRYTRKADISSERDITNNVLLHAVEICERNRQLIVDLPSRSHVLMTSYLLSGVEVLERITDSNNAQSIVRRAFVENGRIMISLIMKFAMFFSRNEFGFILKNSGEGVVEAYGKGFDIDLETDNSTFLTTRVTKCGFHEFFKKNGRPELTKSICDWDNNWSNTLRNSKHVRFHRPTTIASGDKSCDFQFEKKQ